MQTQVKKALPVLPALLCVVCLTFTTVPVTYAQNTPTFKSVNVTGESLQVQIQMKAGTLEIGTHRAGEAKMEFDFTRNSWEPEVQIDSNSGRGRLSIKQPGGSGNTFSMKDDDRNAWKVKLPQAVLTNLEISIGAGESTLDLRGARLGRLEMKAGAGDFTVDLANSSVAELEISAGVGALTLDLSGKRTTGLRATINGGIGDLELRLPQEVGVRVKINGLGGLDTEGFKKEGGYYVNEAYGKTSSSLEITVNGGLGNCTLAMQASAR